MAKPNQTISALAWAELLLLGLVWGGAFYVGRLAVGHVPPLVLVAIRVALAALVLLVVLGWRIRHDLRLAARQWPAFLVLALINNVIPFSLIFAGQTQLGAGVASVINATVPFWTAILAHLLTSDDHIDAGRIVGIALGVAGTMLMLSPSITGLSQTPLWARLAVLGATLSYASAAIFARRFRAIAPPAIATAQLLGSTLIMVPVLLIMHPAFDVAAVPQAVWLAIVALAVFATALAYILYFDIIARAGATNASLVTFLVPISAIALGAILLGERLRAQELLGMTVIFAGLVVFDGRIIRRIASAVRP